MRDDVDVDAYFQRIGYVGPAAPTLAALAAIHARHVDAIPFEGINPLMGWPVPLDLASLHAKLVGGRRGGYCFEQNALLKAVLEKLGFKVTGLAGRVRWMSQVDAPLGPRSHMLLKVDLPEGPYIADVGFGANLLDAPLQLVAEVEQRTAMGTYRLTPSGEDFALAALQPAGWRTMYQFSLHPQLPSDYEASNWFTATHPSVPFTTGLIMERLGSAARYKLVNRRLTTQDAAGRVVEERMIESARDLEEVLGTVFNVELPLSCQALFARLGKF